MSYYNTIRLLYIIFTMTDNTVNARLLIESGIITYTLCCLSSYCADCRAAARFILYEFRSHLVSSTLTDTVQVYLLLTLVIYSGCRSLIKLVSNATKQISQSLCFVLLINLSLLTNRIALESHSQLLQWSNPVSDLTHAQYD